MALTPRGARGVLGKTINSRIDNMNHVIDIANWFLGSIDRDAGDCITHKKLQKLVYYAQAYALALLNKPLFEEDFEAGTHGAIIPTLSEKFKDYSWEGLPAPETVPSFDNDIEALLKDIWHVYGELSAKRLQQLILSEEPWKKAKDNSSQIISKSSMQEYYKWHFDKLNE